MINDKLAALRPTELGVRFTPLDIHNQEFDRTFRGYDEDQVNEYLDLIIKDYQTYNQIIQELQAQIAELLYEDAPNTSEPDMDDILQRIRELEIYSFGRTKD
ncbi:DivIVA domain-containing protein [Paenibacillus thiaminolyticus]|uniref:DivIVA domain-containing protein n=1 Tax=Paenibacillus thiaminolyticus TaxID=49283 RepID=UPI0011657197|nr:DivIVA domain-containing protein [Paenibacillus thiaminolyticus]NGP62060.1 DivIVA domain-containing protein [Paenibacillus thiaminolyticus]